MKDLRMSFKVQVGPAQIAIHQGQTVLLTETDGRVNWPSKCGLYFCDTRVISAWAIYANGELWDLLNGGAVAPVCKSTTYSEFPTSLRIFGARATSPTPLESPGKILLPSAHRGSLDKDNLSPNNSLDNSRQTTFKNLNSDPLSVLCEILGLFLCR